MKLALLVLAVSLTLGALVGVLVARDPGYVLVAYQDLAIETSLWFAALLLGVLYLLIRLTVLLFLRIGRGGGSLRAWSQTRRSRAARDQTVKGLLLLAEARWSEAIKLLEAAAPRVQAPLINYLSAARAASEMGDLRRRDELLRAAHESTPGSRFAVGLTQAELQRGEGQWQACLATLLQLYRQSPRHPQLLRMLVDCYRHIADWQAILELVPELKKHRVMHEQALSELQLQAWRGRLLVGRDDPRELWKAVPRELRREPVLAADFARAIAAAGHGTDAEVLLRAALGQTWEAELVNLYGTLTDAGPERQLATAQAWLEQHPDDPDLLLALGRISLMNRRWDAARVPGGEPGIAPHGRSAERAGPAVRRAGRQRTRECAADPGARRIAGAAAARAPPRRQPRLLGDAGLISVPLSHAARS